jgi:capsular exopolysaccharide synthesis family protein
MGGLGAPQNGASGSGGGPTTSIVKRTLMAIVRFKWMVLAIATLGTGAGFAAVRFQAPEYQTEARLWLSPGIGGAGSPIMTGSLLNATGWQGLLTSSTVLDTVVMRRRMFITPSNPADSVALRNFSIDTRRRVTPGLYKLGLDENQRGFVLQDQNGGVLDRGAFGDSVGESQGFLWVPTRAMIPENRTIDFTVRSPRDVSSGLASQIGFSQRMVAGRADENFLNVTMKGQDPENIAATLEAVMARFDSVALELKRRAISEKTKILSAQLQEAQSKLTAHEATLANFQIETATLPREQTGTPLAAGLSQTNSTVWGNFFSLNVDKDQLTRDRAAILRVLGEQAGRLEMAMSMQLIPATGKSPELSSALKEAIDMEAKLRVELTQFTPEYPAMKAKLEYRDSLYNVVIPQAAATLIRLIDVELADMDSRLASQATELRQIPRRQIEQEKLTRQLDIAADLYKKLEESWQSSRLAEVTTSPDFEILDWPNVPTRPIADTRTTLLLMFIGGALALGIAGAILRDRMDPRVQYPDQVSAGMGLNILGAVPTLKGGRLGPADMALAVESFRSIQLSLMHAAANGGPLMVTFSSPGASDGKSFITSNLAIAFADMGHRTLVIDGDVRRGSMHKLLGARHKPGLTEYLTGRSERAAIIQETRYPLLHFIGCGSRQESGPKLLGSPAMRQLVRDLRADYDVILVDSPPLGACVDPMILATLTKNLVLVVRAGSTDRSLAESKLDMLDRLPVRVVGAVLNDVEQSGPYRYYSYVSGYELLDDETQAALPMDAESTGTPAGSDNRDD